MEGWLTAKKRGRDDDAIERDRKLAQQRRRDEILARRKRNRVEPTKQEKPDEGGKLSKPSKERSEKGDIRGERIGKPTSLELGVFPAEFSLERRGMAERKMPYQNRGKNRKNIQRKAVASKKRSSTPWPSHSANHRHGSNIVTPEKCVRDTSFDCNDAAYQHEIQSSHRKTKVLFAERDFTHRGSNGPSSACRHKRRRRRSHRNLKQNDSGSKMQLPVEPDFDKSAKYLYETIRRRNVTAKYTRGRTKGGSHPFQKGSHLPQELKSTSTNAMGFQMGKNTDDVSNKSSAHYGSLIFGSSCMSQRARKGQNRTKVIENSDSIDRDGKTNISVFYDVKERGTYLRNDVDSRQVRIGRQGILWSYESPAKHNNDDKQKCIRKLLQTSSVQNNGIHKIDGKKCEFDKKMNEMIAFNHSDSDDENQVENHSPSSSVMLCLPMTASFSPPITISSPDENHKGSVDVEYILPREQHKQAGNIKQSPVPVGVDRCKLDPLADIEYWQRIVDNEKRIMKKGSTASFRYNLACIIVAKNSTKGDGRGHTYGTNRSTKNELANRDTVVSGGGLLWLPSILEGGLKHIGLTDVDLDHTC